jgi:peptidyl-prolyl cis-trans isomerase SurA
MQILALQNQIDLSKPARKAELREEVLRQMIDDRLILTEAEKDTLISVTPEEIEQALSEHIENLRAQFGTAEQFEAELAKEGLTFGELRRRFRADTGNQLLKQKLISRKLGTVSITNGEVKEFFTLYADSLPPLPASVKLAHILIPITVDSSRILAVRERLTEIHAQIEAGADFAEMARQYSDDPTAEQGGELGWFGPGDLVSEFENAAQRLQPGQLSGVVRTMYGFHLIEIEEKRGDRYRTRHILLQLSPDAADTAAAMRLADSVRNEILAGADFCELVVRHTGDNDSRKNCGELGWYPVEQMYPEFKAALAAVDTGGYSAPTISEFGVHILHILDRKAGRDYTLADDWDAIKEMARREKTGRVVAAWIANIREETYIDIKQY